MPVESIRDAINKRSDEIIEWTKELIRFPSENRPPEGNEGALQEFIRSECGRLGWEVDTFTPEDVPDIHDHPSWLAGRNYPADRRNVVARWKGRGGRRSLLFSGHADVAPYEPDNWTVCRPYDPVVKDGRLYGRGSADMKSGLAAAYWALRILQDLGVEPAGDILFESLVDEEFAGGNGTLASRLRGHNADLAVVCEPTRMRLCPACLGAFFGDLVVLGNAGMPYMGMSIANPIYGAARVIDLLAEWQEEWRARNHHPLFTEPGSELNCIPWHITSDKPDEFTQMGTPLLTRVSWITWCHPGTSVEECYRAFEEFWNRKIAEHPELSAFEIRMERTFHFVKPWETPIGSDGFKAVAAAYESHMDHSPLITGAPYSSDFGIYGGDGGMACALLGPSGGNLHAPDEWVEVQDILDLTGIYSTLAALWCAAAHR